MQPQTLTALYFCDAATLTLIKNNHLCKYSQDACDDWEGINILTDLFFCIKVTDVCHVTLRNTF